MSESTEHDEKRLWWKEALKRRLIGLCSAGLVGGAPHAAYLAALGMRQDRIFQGYDVIDNRHFAEGAAAARRQPSTLRAVLGLPEHYFLASARFVEKKNLFRLLAAYAAYRRAAGAAPWSLVLLGDGPLRASLEACRAELRLEDSVHLPGFQGYDLLPAFYGLAGAFVHASTSEQWGLVVNEAAAAGLPLLVSMPCGSAPDLVAEGVNGFTFDPEDTDALATLMLQLASPECDRAAMGRASRGIVAHWSPETFAAGLSAAAEAARLSPPRRANLIDKALLRLLEER